MRPGDLPAWNTGAGAGVNQGETARAGRSGQARITLRRPKAKRMYIRPDYETARAQAGFSWSAGGTQGALRALTETPIRDFNLKPAALIDCYRRGRPLLREMFGEDVSLPGLTTPAISYGHVNGLGSELLFPEGGEVAHTHIYASLEEGIRRLQEPVDYATAGMAPFFLDFRRQIQEAFPGENVGFAYGAEGPITTCYELRGEPFFTDIFDKPELAVRFLELVTDSIVDFHRFIVEVHGGGKMPNPSGAGMVDDLSSFIPPRLFGSLVIPAWERYYSALTTGKRSAHIENLKAEQLPYLEEIGLSFYDPSISTALHPKIVSGACRVPFLWRLGSFHYREMSEQDVEDFVYQSCADGASSVVTYVEESLCTEIGVRKVHAFIRAGKEAARLVKEGCSREEIGKRVSPAGKAKLWDGWGGYKGL